MNYTIDFTDPLRSSFQIPAKGLDGPGAPAANSTLRLYGEGALKWGESVDENMLQSLENHAGATVPLYAVPGQLWAKQELYWRNTTIALTTGQPTAAGALYRWNFSTNAWEQFSANVVASLPASGAQTGSYVILPNGSLYRWDRPFQQAELQWMLRENTRKTRAPNAGERPVETLLIRTISGWANASGLNIKTTGLTVDLNTLGNVSDAGIYFAATDAAATLALNYPVTEAGTLFVTPSAWSGCQQMYITRTNRMFLRALSAGWNFVNGPWGNWLEINDYNSIRNKPSTFPPSTHTHTIAQVNGLQAALDAKQNLLGYVPVNKAGDTMTGSLLVNGDIRGSSTVIAGDVWANWSTSTRLDRDGIWLTNGHNKWRFYRDYARLSLAQYTGEGAWVNTWLSFDGLDTTHCYTNFVASANITAWSDPKLKDNMRPAPVTDVIDQLSVKQFEWKAHSAVPANRQGTTDVGFDAEQIKELLPQLVVTSEHEGEQILSVDYSKVTPYLVQKAQTQAAQIEQLTREVAELKSILINLVGDNK